MVAPVHAPPRHVPVTRRHRWWLAGAVSLLLHLAVIGVLASLTPSSRAPERSGLDVVLMPRSASVAATAETPGEAARETANESTETPPAARVPDRPREASSASPASDGAEASVEPEPEPPAVAADADADADKVANAPETRPEPAPPQAPEATGEPGGQVSGRDLLAQATTRIREQGLSAEAVGDTPEAARPAAQRAAEARYIDDWTRRVEDYGNRVHPAPPGLSGRLQIRVVIGRDGQLRRAEVVQSSGHPELDQAALDTVRDAAPYRPFDAGMGDLDSLSISRFWRFGEGNDYGVR
ncbi:TonB family protein [Halomonas borealis]|uniref:TonB family protein n=1 Tax=Halomonas borealis TaxID=2508710 RepID=UPI00109FFC6B|nr:TonB family protein [Halomonas borealis]